MMLPIDVVIIGAGAAGLMCAIEAGKRGRRVIVLDHSGKIAEKIRISGGGRCNFTNLYASPENFLSRNPHFCRSALSRYTQHDFISLVRKHGIRYHEKTLGQLFCDDSAQQIIDMLLSECADAGVTISSETMISSVDSDGTAYNVTASKKGSSLQYSCQSLVIATGGLSIPKIGATSFGYEIAKQFGLRVIPTRPALVPLTFDDTVLEHCRSLSGLSVDAEVVSGKTGFTEGLLFTHRGLSGPSILQISSYWQPGQEITVNLAREHDVGSLLKHARNTQGKQDVQTPLLAILPRRLAQAICEETGIQGRVGECSDKVLRKLSDRVNAWKIRPAGSEGYRTAEVTLGGVDTNLLSSKTMECRKQSGLYFIGEVVDVTGHLGGFNFQWAWSSGYAAGQYV